MTSDTLTLPPPLKGRLITWVVEIKVYFRSPHQSREQKHLLESVAAQGSE